MFAWEEFVAPPHWRAIDLISDLHLGEATPITFNAWVQYLKRTRADAVWMLGDLFEVWPGDDVRHRPFERACADEMRRASERLNLGFMAGNRDFLVGDEMLQACGMSRLADPTLLVAFGQRVMLTHGDALCLGDSDYQRFRQEVRTNVWQTQFLARPLEERMTIAASIRAASEVRKREKTQADDWADVDPGAAVALMQCADASVMIHGHTHRPGHARWSLHHTREVLSDWDGEAGPLRAEVIRISVSGIERLPPDAT